MERPKTMTSLQMAFAKMTLTMTNAIMTALIAALHTVIRTIALNVIVKVVFQTIPFDYIFPDCILNLLTFSKTNFIVINSTGVFSG